MNCLLTRQKRGGQRIPFRFSGYASYVLAGGLGGLGRSIAWWMASRGAKNFIFLSRSGAQKPALANFVQEMREKHCRVEMAQCDITDL